MYRELLESPAWVELVKAAEVQIHHRRQKYNFAPLNSTDALLQQQWELGEASGIDLFVRLPQSIIDGCEAVIAERTQHEKQVGSPSSE